MDRNTHPDNTHPEAESILTDAGPDELERAIEANGVECCVCWTGWAGMQLGENEHLTWTESEVAFPFFNNVLRARIPGSQVDTLIGRVLQRAGEKGLPLFWWTGPSTLPVDLGDRLVEHGFQHAFEAPGMAIDLRAVADDTRLTDGLMIREVTGDSEMQDWCRVMTPVYEFPEFAARAWLEMLSALGLGPGRRYRHFVAYQDGQPVGTSSLLLSAGVAGISSVATLPQARRKGIGTAITRAPLLLARDMGYRYGVLFSSPMGLGVYRRLGFREYTTGNCYVWPAD